jgi:hypothetical protein
MIICTKYTPINKGSIMGVFSVIVDKWGIELYDLTLFRKNDRKWVNFPSKKYEKDGETKYFPYYRFVNNDPLIAKKANEEFSRQCIAAIEKKAMEDNISLNEPSVKDSVKKDDFESLDIKEEEIPF